MSKIKGFSLIVLLSLLAFGASAFSKPLESKSIEPKPVESKSIDWQSLPWIENYQAGKTRASNENRPAFIYFQARWCSWCHLYERNILGSPAVMNILKRDYVLMLVNYDARPDLFRHYVGVGLPHSVIIAADGAVLARLPGVLSVKDMVTVLTEVSQGRVHAKPTISEEIAGVNGLDKKSYSAFKKQYLDWLEQLFDVENNTLTGQLKITAAGLKRPSPLTWLYLLQQQQWSSQTRAATDTMLLRLWDDIDGGFFYFVDPHRDDEHLETAKLLPANAWLSLWLAEAGVRYQNPQWQEVARQGMVYLQQTLWDQSEGGFFQAQFSDPEYYALDKKARAGRSPPAIDSLKLVDSNAQAAFALVQTGERLNDRGAYQLAAKTMDYILHHHYQNGRLHHSREHNQLGTAYNLAEDIFWLLVAGEAVQAVLPDKNREKQLLQIKKLAAQWLEKNMKKQPVRPISLELIGLIAWVSLSDKQQLLPPATTAWALREIRIDAATRPDELVFALKSWRRYIAASQ